MCVVCVCVCVCADLDQICAAFVLGLCDYGDADKTAHPCRLASALASKFKKAQHIYHEILLVRRTVYVPSCVYAKVETSQHHLHLACANIEAPETLRTHAH